MFRLSLALLVLPLLSGTAIGQTRQSQAPIACREDRDKIEDADCRTKLKGLVTRNGDKLTLQLDGGKSQTYTGNRPACNADDVDKCLVFRMMQYFPQTRSYLVSKGYYEGADYLFVSQRTGSELAVSDILALSPNAKFLIAIDQNDAGERAFDIAIWSMDSDPPKQEFKYNARRYENWEVLAWKGDSHISMKAWVNDTTSFDQEAELIRQSGGWSLVLGKKTDRSQ